MSITYINDVRNEWPFPTPEYHLSILVPPVDEPVSLDDFKLHAYIPDDSQDSILPTYISAAREKCEVECERTFATQTYKLTIDTFPCDGGFIRLRRPPVQSVTSIQYKDSTGHLQTLDPSMYLVDYNDQYSPRIIPTPNNSWPTTQDSVATIEIIYVAGYPGDTANDAIPARAKLAIMMEATAMYERRSPLSESQVFTNPQAQALLSTLRVLT